ncbi:unnamed protein product [Sphagnum troendelagicum]|uniref:Phospholipid/glycerol acyltransferase domain-containing protein n=1 Tax=Sphagnum troendelagicum TaxID=128251 RepID=A0ABP0UFZ9_9BRYO
MEDVFEVIENCSTEGREHQTVVADLDGTLLRSRSSFPYFFLVAFEAGGYFRAAALLFVAPLIWFLYHLVSEGAGIELMIYITFVGLRVKDIEGVARAVLPKFYTEDIHSHTWRVFSSFDKRYLLTANPRIMVEPFAKDFMGVDEVLGSEIEVSPTTGRATGFVLPPGVLVGVRKEKRLKKVFGYEAEAAPDVGLGDRPTDYPFMSLCKEGYIVPAATKVEAVKKHELPKPIVFHDGRLVQRPTPGNALIVLLWMPLGFLLALVRLAVGKIFPVSILYDVYALLGIKIIVKGTLPQAPVPQKNKNNSSTSGEGILFACTHRTLLDPVIVSVALRRRVPAVTYSISRISELLSPMKTVALCRDREKDATIMRKILESGSDLTLCPEGTTCREPYLLRFSALFTELSDRIVPVATLNKAKMFHGTTARGNKAMDPFFIYMNPRPVYEITFLRELPRELSSSSGGSKSAIEVANRVQKLLASTLGFQCTQFTRKDKYQMLAGNDGTVVGRRRYQI